MNKNSISNKESLRELADIYSIELEHIAKRNGITFSRFNIDDLTEEEKSTIYREFIEWLTFNNLITPENDGEDPALEEFLTKFYGNIDQLKKQLLKFQEQTKSPVKKSQIKKIIVKIEKVIAPAKRHDVPITQPILLNFNLSDATNEKIENLYEIADRATFYYQLSHGYGAEDNSSESGIVTEKTKNQFSKLSMDELVAKFSPAEFYKLSPADIKDLVSATSQRYCLDNKVPPCSVSFSKLNTSESRVTLGTYSWANQNISLNSRILERLNEFDYNKNPYLPYALLQVVIHETQHRVQHGNLDKIALDSKDKLVKNAIMNPSGIENRSFMQYQSALEEQDARNAALSFIQKYAARSTDSAFKAFSDLETIKECRTKKYDITGKDCEIFPFLYSESLLGSKNSEQSKIKSQRDEFYSMLTRNTASADRENTRVRERTRF